MRHDKITASDIHIVYFKTYANAAARTGDTTVTSEDIGKVAWQTDDNSFYILVATTPTWLEITNSSASPGGNDTYVQFNDSGSFGGVDGFVFDKDNDQVGIAGPVSVTVSEKLKVHGDSIIDGYVNITGDVLIGGSNKELRFYEAANYVGFEAPALTANQIWVLPSADGNQGEVIKTDGSGNLDWHPNIRTVYGFSRDTIDPGATLAGMKIGEVTCAKGAGDTAVGYVLIRAGKITGVSMTQIADLQPFAQDKYTVYVYCNNTLVTSWDLEDSSNEYEYVDDSLAHAVSQGDEISVLVSDTLAMPPSTTALEGVVVVVEVSEGL